MQLAGPGVFGPPKDRDAAIAVLRAAVDLGIRHIDTADFYGPYVTNELIRDALAPYPDDLHIVTKVGARRDERGGWPHARTPAELREQVHDNLRHLKLDVLDVVNLRRRHRGTRAGLDRGAVRDARRAAAAGADPAPGPQYGHRRPVGRGAVDRPGRLRSEPL
jgi:aryl-alcohol dehydrogenase-like predicted oxidoreductase